MEARKIHNKGDKSPSWVGEHFFPDMLDCDIWGVGDNCVMMRDGRLICDCGNGADCEHIDLVITREATKHLIIQDEKDYAGLIWLYINIYLPRCNKELMRVYDFGFWLYIQIEQRKK